MSGSGLTVILATFFHILTAVSVVVIPLVMCPQRVHSTPPSNALPEKSDSTCHKGTSH